MARLAYFRFYPADFLGGVRFLSPAAIGVYIQLLCMEWENGPLPADPDILSARVPGFAEAWPSLASKFVEGEDGLLRNERLEAERSKASKDALTFSDRARNAARAKHASSMLQASLKDANQNQNQNQSQNQTQDEAAARLLAPTRDAKPPRSKPKDAIRWSPSESWVGISDADRQAWAVAYPACDIGRQLAAMEQWLLANPAKAKKSAWRRFVTTWMGRSQDRGGDARSNRAAKPAQKVESW